MFSLIDTIETHIYDKSSNSVRWAACSWGPHAYMSVGALGRPIFGHRGCLYAQAEYNQRLRAKLQQALAAHAKKQQQHRQQQQQQQQPGMAAGAIMPGPGGSYDMGMPVSRGGQGRASAAGTSIPQHCSIEA